MFYIIVNSSFSCTSFVILNEKILLFLFIFKNLIIIIIIIIIHLKPFKDGFTKVHQIKIVTKLLTFSYFYLTCKVKSRKNNKKKKKKGI